MTIYLNQCDFLTDENEKFELIIDELILSSLKYAWKFSALNLQILAASQPLIRFFSFRYCPEALIK